MFWVHIMPTMWPMLWVYDMSTVWTMLRCIYHVHHGTYRKTSNVRRALVGNKIVDHSDVVGASPVGAAPTSGFNEFGKDRHRTIWESFNCRDLVWLILETRRYFLGTYHARHVTYAVGIGYVHRVTHVALYISWHHRTYVLGTYHARHVTYAVSIGYVRRVAYAEGMYKVWHVSYSVGIYHARRVTYGVGLWYVRRVTHVALYISCPPWDLCSGYISCLPCDLGLMLWGFEMSAICLMLRMYIMPSMSHMLLLYDII